MEMTRLKSKEKCLSFLYFVNVLLAVEGFFPPFGYFVTRMSILEASMQNELNFSKKHFISIWCLYKDNNSLVIQKEHHY